MLYNDLNLSVARFASKNEYKPEVIGVFFTPDKTCATDTFRLLEVSVNKNMKPEEFPRLPDGTTAMRGMKPFIIPADSVKEMVKMKRGKNPSLPILEYIAVSRVDDNQVNFFSTNLEVGDTRMIRRLEGTFPDYEAIMPKGEPKVKIFLNGKMLSELLDTLSKVSKDAKVEMKVYGETQPIYFEASNAEQKARGLLMPMK